MAAFRELCLIINENTIQCPYSQCELYSWLFCSLLSAMSPSLAIHTRNSSWWPLFQSANSHSSTLTWRSQSRVSTLRKPFLFRNSDATLRVSQGPASVQSTAIFGMLWTISMRVLATVTPCPCIRNEIFWKKRTIEILTVRFPRLIRRFLS